MPQNHQSPSGTFVPMPVSEVKPGDIVLWYGIQVTVESVTPLDNGETHLVTSYRVSNECSLENTSTIHVWKAGSEV